MDKFVFEAFAGETWKAIKDFDGYFVSDFGRIWSNNQKPRFLNFSVDNCGYSHVKLYKDKKVHSRLVHRLVAEHFVENPNDYMEVNHIDENKNNNRYDNLEWCTRKYNNLYGEAGKKRYVNMGLTQRYSRNDLKAVECLDVESGKVVHKFNSIAEASRMMPLKTKGSIRCVRSNIGSCCNQRKSKNTAYGYRWRFADV